jgi:hypothetical protein
MKNIAIAAVLFSLLVAPFSVSTQTKAPPKAQTPAPPAAAVPAQKSAPPAAPAAVVATPSPDAQAKPMKSASHRVPSTADARACLEFPTNLQIIKCADKYRWASPG